MFLSLLKVSAVNAQCTHTVEVGSNVGVSSVSVAVSMGLLIENSGTITSQNFKINGNFLIDAPRTFINCDIQVENNGFIEFISSASHFINNTNIYSCGIGYEMEIVDGIINIQNGSSIASSEFRVYESQMIVSNSTFTSNLQTQHLKLDFSTVANIAHSNLLKTRIEINNQSSLNLSKSYINGDNLFLNSIIMDGQSVYLGSENQFESMNTIIRTGLSPGFKWAREHKSTISRLWNFNSNAFYYKLDGFSLFEFIENEINSLGPGIQLIQSVGNTYIKDNNFNYDPNHNQFFSHPGISIHGGTHAEITDNILYGSIFNNANTNADILRNEMEGFPSITGPEGIWVFSGSQIQIRENEIANYQNSNVNIVNANNVAIRRNNITGSPIGVELREAPNTFLDCNNITWASTYGLGLKGNCSGLIHRGSYFENIYQGLDYQISVQTGNQPNRGNRYYNYIIGGVSNVDPINSRYIYPPSATDQNPMPQIFPGSLWFDPTGHFSHSCTMEEPPRDTIGVPDVSALLNMIECYEQASIFEDGLCFSILQSAYRTIAANLDWIEDPELLDFYYHNTTTAIGMIPEVFDILVALKETRIDIPENFATYTQEELQNHQIIQSIMDAGNSWYNQAMQAKQEVIEDFRNLLSLVALNTELIATNVEVLKALLDFYQFGEQFEYDEIYLSTIASGCIQEYGNAVYIAQSLSEALHIEYTEASASSCLEGLASFTSTNFDSNQVESASKNPNPIFYPNPTSDFLHFNDSFDFQIINTLGHLVQSGFNERGIIDVQSLPSGVYLVHNLSNQKIYKFIKQ